MNFGPLSLFGILFIWLASCTEVYFNGNSCEGLENNIPDAGTETYLRNSWEGLENAIPDAGTETHLCDPGAISPSWALEGETIEVQIGCRTGLPLAGEHFFIESLPPGTTYSPEEATVTWETRLDQAAVWNLIVTDDVYNESGTAKVGIADNFAHPDNVAIVDPAKYSEEYGLPVLFLMSPPVSPDQYAATEIVYRGRSSNGQGKKRGKSSLSYPKNSYTLKFENDDRFSEPYFGGGFKNKKKVVLTTTFDDNSYIRTRLAFDMWNRLNPEGIQIQTYSAVVYLGLEYQGLYTVSDHVDKHLMAAHGLWKDGNLYKCNSHSCNFRRETNWGDEKKSLHEGVEKKHPNEEDTPGAYDDFDDLVAFVADDHDTPQSLSERVRLADYENWWFLVMFTYAEDSAAKNSYHYHDPRGGLWRYIPWDFNWSFGQDWKTRRFWGSADEDFILWNGIWERMMEDDHAEEELRSRLLVIADNQYLIDDLYDLMDEYENEILPSIQRDWQKWETEYRNFSWWADRTDFTNPEQEANYVREWILNRWSALSE